MKHIENIYFLELDECIQDQVAREFVDDFDRGYNPSEFKDNILELFEYDPNNIKDLEILEDFLLEKVREEGMPSDEDLSYYINDLDQLINFPILIIQGSCVEGRHRLATAIKTKSKIRGYYL